MKKTTNHNHKMALLIMAALIHLYIGLVLTTSITGHLSKVYVENKTKFIWELVFLTLSIVSLAAVLFIMAYKSTFGKVVRLDTLVYTYLFIFGLFVTYMIDLPQMQGLVFTWRFSGVVDRIIMLTGFLYLLADICFPILFYFQVVKNYLTIQAEQGEKNRIRSLCTILIAVLVLVSSVLLAAKIVLSTSLTEGRQYELIIKYAQVGSLTPLVLFDMYVIRKYQIKTIFHVYLIFWIVDQFVQTFFIHTLSQKSCSYIYQILLLLSDILVIYIHFYSLAQKKQRDIELKAREELQLEEFVKRAEYIKLEQKRNQYSMIRHDMNNQLTTIGLLMEMGHSEEAESLLAELVTRIHDDRG